MWFSDKPILKKKKKNQTFLTGEEVKSYSTEGIILPNGRD